MFVFFNQIKTKIIHIRVIWYMILLGQQERIQKFAIKKKNKQLSKYANITGNSLHFMVICIIGL
jgi:ssDNA-specific exonuclease RecJ